MVDDGCLFSHAQRILSCGHIAHRAHMRVLHMAGPIRIQDARVRSDFVAFGMEVMLDRANAPNAHLIGRFHDVRPFVDDLVIHVAVVAERTLGLTVFLTVSGEHRIKLQYDFGFGHFWLLFKGRFLLRETIGQR